MITSAIIAGLLGVLTWSLLEYVIHRFAAHGRGFWRVTPFNIEHTRHHAEGDYFAPATRKALAALIVLPLLAKFAIVLSSFVAGTTYATSLVITYLAYEMLHRRLHTHASSSGYGHWARRHHFHHHFVDPRTNHGVTSPLWDIVFGTYRQPTTIIVPKRLCMPWLVDSRTGDIIETYADTFSLAKPKDSNRMATR